VSAATVSEGLARVRQALGVLGAIELYIALAAFAFVASLTAVQVVYRYGFDGAIWWAQEVAQLGMLVAYFFGISYVYKANQDIVVIFAFRLFPRRVQAIGYVLIQLLVAVFCGFVAVEGIRLAPNQLVFKTYILNIPKFYSTLPLIIASLSMIVTALYYAASVWSLARRDGFADEVETLEGRALILKGPEATI